MADPKLAFGWGVGLVNAPGTTPVYGIYKDTDREPTNSLWGNSPILAALCLPEKFVLLGDDFINAIIETDNYAFAKDNSGTAQTGDTLNGEVSIACDVNANDAALLSTLREIALLATAKPAWFECKVTLTESGTNLSNACVGLSDDVTVGLMDDSGGVLPADYDGVLWHKIEATAVWAFETSKATAQVTTADAGAHVSGTSQLLGWHYDGVTTLTPYFNGTAGTAHTVAANAAADLQHFVWGVKSSGTAAQTLTVDWWRYLAVR